MADVAPAPSQGAQTNEKMRRFKLALMGPGGVGKSALAVRFCQHVFDEQYALCVTTS